MADDGLTLDLAPGRNGSATLTARLAGDVLHVEKLDLSKSKQRTAFAEKVCDGRPGIEREALDAELLKLAAKMADKPNEAPADFSGLPEIDSSRIIRPERAITPEVSTVAVPTMASLGERVAGRWQLYLRWADGQRERRALGPMLELPDDGRLWIHPEPSEPTPNMLPGWTAHARRRWLDGEPAPAAAKLFERLAEQFSRFLDLPATQAQGVTATLVCWTILTYAFQAWPATPYLYVGGPLGSGKSRVFDILGRLVFRPLATSNLTAASLFRTLHTQGGTLILDEAERLKNTGDPDIGETLSMLLAGYKSGATSIRLESVGDNGFRTVAFDVYGPKALACIKGLPPALASRAIPVTMFRAGPGSDKPRRRIDADPGRWRALRDELHALALEHGRTFLGLAEQVDVCPAMSGRDFELWQPLLALASWIEEAGMEGLLGLLQEHALATIDAGRDDQTPDHDETLLRLLADSIRFGERPTPGDLLEKARAAEPDGFKRWSAKGVAEHLKSYGLATLKTDGRRRYARVTREDLGKIETNYGIDLGLNE